MTSIKHGESQANVSYENGVPESTIHVWLKNKEKLCDFVDMVNVTDQMNRKK